MKQFLPITLFLLTLIPCVGLAVQDEKQQEEFSAQQLEFFENKVRPILVNRCYECHSGEKTEGGLNLESRKAILKGGDYGPAIEVGDPEESLIIDAVNYGDFYEMPPKSKLPQEEIDILTKWVEEGAAWPATDDIAISNEEEFDVETRKGEHWCWQSVIRPKIPEIESEWGTDPLDKFIEQQVSSAGLKVAPQADRATLLRRLCFDLVGLPPTPAQIQAYVVEQTMTLEQMVDELLASPHFGERWARHWMDLTRYAETCGHEFDYPIHNAYRYRDYLIRAFNSDVSYDQLVREHIAGDLLTEPRRNPKHQYNESILGTGFWFLGEATHGPVDVKGDEAGHIDNQIDVMTKTFLGLTVACARCHDHKFDAISTEDYYSLSGFLQSSRRQDAMLDFDLAIENSFEKVQPLNTESAQLLSQMEDLLARGDADVLARYLESTLKRVRANSLEGTPGPATLSADALAQKHGLENEVLKRMIASFESPALQSVSHPLHPLSWVADGKTALDENFWNSVGQRFEAAAGRAQKSRVDSVKFADFDSNDHGWFRTGFGFQGSVLEPSFVEQDTTEVVHPGVLNSGTFGGRFYGVVRSPTFEITHPKIHMRVRSKDARIRLVIDGYIMDEFNGLLFADALVKNATHDQWEWRTQSGDIKKYLGHRAHIEIIDHNDGFAAVDEIWFSNGGSPRDFPSELQQFVDGKTPGSLKELCEQMATRMIAVMGDKSEDSSRDRVQLLTWILKSDLQAAFGEEAESNVSLGVNAERMSLNQRITQFKEIRNKINALANQTPRPQMAVAMTDGSAENEHVFVRGNHKTLGHEAKRQFLEALAGDDANRYEKLRGSGRLRLVEQMVDRSNPLTSRVMVNRIWHHLTGRGIVASVDNFGVLGTKPTNPELLDYLADEFVENGWSIKGMIRRVVLSSTYQMSSRPNPDAIEIDPDNELMHRARIRRLQGEAIRDAVLAASGELDHRLYGPSAKVHLTPFMQGRGRPGKSGPLDGDRRRSVYVEVRRNFLSPMMLAFDTPIPFNATGRRNLSNVPSQALILMNDAFVLEQAAKWSARLCEKLESDEDRVRSIYLAAFGRTPTDSEMELAKKFISLQAKELGKEELSPEVWADFCHVIFNVKEFIHIK